MSAFGVISEEKITLWRHLSLGPYCPNGLSGVYCGSKALLGVEIGIMRKVDSQSKFAPLKTKKRLSQALMCQGVNCTSVYKEKGAASTVQKICV